MTTPLERDLAERLERLAAAVPVRAGQLDPVHVAAVRARQQLRMRWLTPLIVLLLLAVLYVLLNAFGSDGPSSLRVDPSTADASSPTGMDRDGDFALTLRAAKRNYAPDERIDVIGTLTYFGPRQSVVIHTDSSGPMMFGIEEMVFGAVTVGQVSLLMCEQSTLTRGQPLIEPFRKGFFFDGQHPDAPKFLAWAQDKDLRLPEGTWHLYVTAAAPCMGGDVSFNLRAEIEIVVGAANATPGLPVATPWNDAPVYGGDDIGWMALQVKSLHPTYEVGSQIDLETWFWFMEGDPKFFRPFTQEVEFRITQVDANATEIRSGDPLRTCDTTTMALREERHVPLDERNVVLIEATSWPEASDAALRNGLLVLPEGRWRITVTVRAMFGPCGEPTETWETHASVEVDVVPKG